MSAAHALRRFLAPLLLVALLAGWSLTTGGGASAVIVRAEPGAVTRALHVAAELGARDLRPLPLIDGFAATVPDVGLARLRAAPGVVDVAPDRVVRPSSVALEQTRRAIAAVGAETAWAQGADGKGVDVALIDSGLAAGSAFRGRNVLAGPDLSGSGVGSALTDEFGHGTHMAGILVGHADDAHGLAPKARVVSVKVAGGDGVTTASKVIAGLDWVVANARTDGRNIRVVNLSFGVDLTGTYVHDPLAYAVERVWSHGVVVAAAVGNDGSVDSPARDPYVLAVGAAGFDALGAPGVPGWSSCDATRGPDLVAPGTSIISARAPGSTLDVRHPSARFGERGFVGSGTSQATAAVSAAAALLLGARPELAPDQVKQALTASATPVPGVATACQGAGMLRIDRALAQAVGPDGWQTWPAAQWGVAADAPDACRITVDEAAAADGDAPPCPQEGAPLGSHWSGSHWSGSHWSGSHWSGSHWSTALWG